jgi:hypothetical protein
MAADHSGTTLIAFLLDMHPAIVSLGESCPPLAWFGPEYECSCGEQIRSCPFYTRLYEEVQARGERFSAEEWTNRFRYKNQALRWLLSDYPYNRLKRSFQDVMHRFLPFHRQRLDRVRRVSVAYFQGALKVAGAKVFCDTSKGLDRLQHLRLAPELDIHLIWLIRDVRAFVFSCKKFGIGASTAAGRWLHYQSNAAEIFDSFADDRKIQIRYDDLCQDVDGTLGQIHEFIGLDRVPLPGVIDLSQHHVLGNKMRTEGKIKVRWDDKWRRELDPAERDLAMSIAGDMNDQLGFS